MFQTHSADKTSFLCGSELLKTKTEPTNILEASLDELETDQIVKTTTSNKVCHRGVEAVAMRNKQFKDYPSTKQGERDSVFKFNASIRITVIGPPLKGVKCSDTLITVEEHILVLQWFNSREGLWTYNEKKSQLRSYADQIHFALDEPNRTFDIPGVIGSTMLVEYNTVIYEHVSGDVYEDYFTKGNDYRSNLLQADNKGRQQARRQLYKNAKGTKDVFGDSDGEFLMILNPKQSLDFPKMDV